MDFIVKLFSLFFKKNRNSVNYKRVEPTFSVNPENLNVVIKSAPIEEKILKAKIEPLKNQKTIDSSVRCEEEKTRNNRSHRGIKIMKERIHQNNVTLRRSIASYCYNSTNSR